MTDILLEPASLDDAASTAATGGTLSRFWHRPLGVGAAAFLVLIALAAALAPFIVSAGPDHQDLLTLFAGPSGKHPLGTDDLGRDTLSRLLYGARVSLLVGVAAVAVSIIIAVPIGFVAGYRGGWAERVVNGLADVLLSVPPLVLVFAIAGVLGPSVTNLAISLAVFFVPLFVRLTLTETRHLRRSTLVQAEIALGVPQRSIAWRHVLPNITSPLLVQVAANVGTAIIAEAGLSFLGLGVRPPAPSWGVMLREGFQYITSHPWMTLPPAVAVLLTVLAFNLVADALRDALNRREPA